MKFVATTLVMFSLLLSSDVIAGKEAGNGGNTVGLEFKVLANQAVDELAESRLAIATPKKVNELRTVLSKARIVFVDSDLYVSTGNDIQRSAAVNDPKLMTIKLSKDFAEIQDPRLKRALAIHELEGLLGNESTGVYVLSAAYLAFLGFERSAADALGNLAGKPEASSSSVTDAMYCELSVSSERKGVVYKAGDYLSAVRADQGKFENYTAIYGNLIAYLSGATIRNQKRVNVDGVDYEIEYSATYSLANLNFKDLAQKLGTQASCIRLSVSSLFGRLNANCANSSNPADWGGATIRANGSVDLAMNLFPRPVITNERGVSVSVVCRGLNDGNE